MVSSPPPLPLPLIFRELSHAHDNMQGLHWLVPWFTAVILSTRSQILGSPHPELFLQTLPFDIDLADKVGNESDVL